MLFAAIAEYADGWMPIGGAGIAGALDGLRRAFDDAGRDPAGLEVLPFGTVPDEGKLDYYASIHCTEVVLRIPSGPESEILATLGTCTPLRCAGTEPQGAVAQAPHVPSTAK